MTVFTKIQDMLDTEKDIELIRLCIGPDSELSNEIAKHVMGRRENNIRTIMSNLRNGVHFWGSDKKKTKDLNNLEHIDELKKKVKIILKYFSIELEAPETQEGALEKHIDNIESHNNTHDQLDNIANLLDPIQITSRVVGMPNETDEQQYKLVTACRKTVRQLQNIIGDNRPGADAYIAEQKQNIQGIKH